MFYTVGDVIRLCRVFRGMPCEVSEELRGWSWSVPPLLYSYDFLLPVSDIASGFCDTGRFIYLKYVAREKEKPSWRLRRGSLIHSILSEASSAAKSLVFQGILSEEEFREEFMAAGEAALRRCREEFKDLKDVSSIFKLLWLRAANTFSSELAKARARSPYLSVDGIAALVFPFSTEFPVDGSLIGLSKTLRIDIVLYPNIVAEIKTRRWHPDYELGVAAYALAFESQYEVPVNYGVVLLVKMDPARRDLKVYERVVRISDRLRQMFIDKRDEYAKIIEESLDPGKPRKCNPDCPYLHACCRGEAL